MKKFLTLILSLTFVFALSACLGGGGRGETEVNVLDELPDEPIEITLWHAFGDDNAALLQAMFDDFEDMYPQVSITQLGQGGYDGLRESTIQSIVAGTTPTMVFGYPDHFVEYLNGNALVPLDDYIAHADHGVDLDDFVPGFLAENQQYLDGFTYSMPFAKSTEMVVYNKTVFDHHGIELSMTEPLTWDDIEGFADTIQGTGDMQCEFIFNADSAANFFIVNSRQWQAGYTNNQGEILVDNPQTRDMLNFFVDMFDRDIVSFPIEWDENYGSIPFKDGRVCMSQGSTAGTRHNIPNQADGKFGIFEMGIVPVIQKADGAQSVMQQGPNVAVMSDATDAERLASWLLIKHMTSTENTSSFAMSTGYVPVRQSAFETAEYQAFLSIVDKYQSGDDLSFDEQDRLPYAMAATVAYAQVDYYGFDAAFVGRVTSSGARREAGLAFEAIYAGTRTVDEAIQRMKNQLGG